LKFNKWFLLVACGVVAVTLSFNHFHHTDVSILVGNILASSALVALAGICENTISTTRYLGLNEQYQQQSEWCWGATTVSISLFYNPASTWTQCSLVNNAFGQTTCCTNGNTWQCNKGWFPNLSLAITGNLSPLPTSAPEPLFKVMFEINGGRPISIGIWWSGGGGHSIVIDGYDNSNPSAPTIDIQDPWYGPSTQDFNSFPNSYHGTGTTWGTTYFTKG
jgi:hypothetical protein